jgi:hypothetical protein
MPENEYQFETHDYDEDELNDGEEIIMLTNDEIPKEMGTKKKEKDIFNTVPMKAL